MIRTFGCLCYVGNINPIKSKFDQRAYKCLFLGYVRGQKAYRIFDIEKNKTLISRDVIFHENILPYRYIHQESSTNVSSLFCPSTLPLSDTYITPFHAIPYTEDDSDMLSIPSLSLETINENNHSSPSREQSSPEPLSNPSTQIPLNHMTLSKTSISNTSFHRSYSSSI